MSTSTTPATPAAFQKLRDELNPLFIARGNEIDALLLALVAKCHIFLLSTPGAAKTMLFREFLKRVHGARAFFSIFDPGADDSLVFGPPSVPKLMEGKRERETAGYLPHAHMWLADELWNGSSALLQALHQVTLERKIKQGADEIDVDLWTMLGTSNVLPASGQNLEAIWDRVALRLVSEPIQHADQMRALFDLPDPVDNPERVLDWAHVVDAHEQAMAVPISSDADEAFIGILIAASSHGVQLSGRRMKEARRIAQANAWLAGAATVEIGHFDFLTDFLWDRLEQRAPIARIVLDVAAPLRAKCQEKLGVIAQLRDEMTGLNKLDKKDPNRSRAETPLFTKILTVANETAELEVQARTPRDRNALADVAGHVQSLAHDFIVVTRGMKPQNVPDVMAQARAA